MEANVISVIKGATGTNSKSLTEYPSNILGKHEIKELQKKRKKPSILGTAHTYSGKCYSKSTEHIGRAK